MNAALLINSVPFLYTSGECSRNGRNLSLLRRENHRDSRGQLSHPANTIRDAMRNGISGADYIEEEPLNGYRVRSISSWRISTSAIKLLDQARPRVSPLNLHLPSIPGTTRHRPNDPLTVVQTAVKAPNDQQNQANGAEYKEYRENKTNNLAKDHEDGIEFRIKLSNGVIKE